MNQIFKETIATNIERMLATLDLIFTCGAIMATVVLPASVIWAIFPMVEADHKEIGYYLILFETVCCLGKLGGAASSCLLEMIVNRRDQDSDNPDFTVDEPDLAWRPASTT